MNREHAITIALKILQFLVSDENRVQALLMTTGLSPEDLRRGASDPAFLAGIVDYLLTDDRMIIAFAAEEGLKPENIVSVRRSLPGGEVDF